MYSRLCFSSFYSAKPVVGDKETKIEVYKDNDVATITWGVDNPESLSWVGVKVCEMKTTECLAHNVTDVSGTSQVSVPQGANYQFSFYLYDGVDIVSKQENAICQASGRDNLEPLCEAMSTQ